MNLDELVEQNRAQLASARALLASITDAQLIARDATLYPHGGIGPHYRHILDYYTRFLEAGSRIDYDARTRDGRVESDRAALLERLHQVDQGLASLAERGGAERSLRVRDNGRGVDEDFVESSVGRELAFLLSHAVHHFAVVGLMVKLMGVTPPDGFGVARSTQRYLEQRAS